MLADGDGSGPRGSAHAGGIAGGGRGKLVVFEGVEGSGKSTQVRLLLSRLEQEKMQAVGIREPGTSPVGNAIRELLLDPAYDMDARAEALLFLAARAQLVSRELQALLNTVPLVVCDRFMLSTYAYQGVGRGLGVDSIRELNRFATGGLVPDVTVLLEVDPELGLQRAANRGAADRMEAAGAEFHVRVAEAFRMFGSADWQAAHPECGPIVTVDASGTQDQVFERVRSALSGFLPETFSAASMS